MFINTSALITLTFGVPPVTVDEFFGENLVSNLALFLGISTDNIIIANAVAVSRRRRRKRTGVTEIVIQIGNNPGTDIMFLPTVKKKNNRGILIIICKLHVLLCNKSTILLLLE